MGPLVGVEARERVRRLASGERSSISLRYDWVIDWVAMNKMLDENSDTIHLYDGEEWFTLEPAT